MSFFYQCFVAIHQNCSLISQKFPDNWYEDFKKTNEVVNKRKLHKIIEMLSVEEIHALFKKNVFSEFLIIREVISVLLEREKRESLLRDEIFKEHTKICK